MSTDSFQGLRGLPDPWVPHLRLRNSTMSVTQSSLETNARTAMHGESSVADLRVRDHRDPSSAIALRLALVSWECADRSVPALSIFGHFCPRGPTCGRERCSFDDSVSVAPIFSSRTVG